MSNMVKATVNRLLVISKGRRAKDKLNLLIMCGLSFIASICFRVRFLNLICNRLLSNLKFQNTLLTINQAQVLIHNITQFYHVTDPINESEFHQIEKLKLNKVAIDVGANMGLHSFAMQYYGAQMVISIEPDLETFAYLTENIELNNAKEKIIPLRLAAYSKKCALEFFKAESGSGLGSLVIKPENTTEVYKVPCDSLDHIVIREGIDIKDIQFIKIDVEGAELEVLKGARKILETAKPTIMFEANNQEARIKTERFISEFGYSNSKELNHCTFVVFPKT